MTSLPSVSVDDLQQLSEFQWLLPKKTRSTMLVDGMIYGSEQMVKSALLDKALEQVINVAMLPGIVGQSMAMPDLHWGYGFPIGGVAAFDAVHGVISPGGVGYDINCGVRLLRTNLSRRDIQSRLKALVVALYQSVPAGVGSDGKLRLTREKLKSVLKYGSKWAVQEGFGWQDDLMATESSGCMIDADPDGVSERALERGLPQLGTLGSGNHFLEIQVVDRVFDQVCAEGFGLEVGQVVVMIHCGSRGLGYQVCEDSIAMLQRAGSNYGISIPDRQLICAPLQSPEGEGYFRAMAAAANYAWANRQCIAHWVRTVFEDIFNQSAEQLGMKLVYDVAHNIAKYEEHEVAGEMKQVCVHRKGATRSFGKGHSDLPECYQQYGQPVLIPGSMGTASYVCVGTAKAMEQTFGSTCHGAGRLLSRHAALKQTKNRSIVHELGQKGIQVMARSRKTLGEESPEAYKDIDEVVQVVDELGFSRKVARLIPLAVVKG